MNKMLRAAVLVAALVVAVPTAAQATSVVDRSFGWGYAKAAGWTKGYHRVMFVATSIPRGSRVGVSLTVRCNNGTRLHRSFVVYTSWTYTVWQLPTYTRCYETFVVSTGNTNVNVGAGIYA